MNFLVSCGKWCFGKQTIYYIYKLLIITVMCTPILEICLCVLKMVLLLLIFYSSFYKIIAMVINIDKQEERKGEIDSN